MPPHVRPGNLYWGVCQKRMKALNHLDPCYFDRARNGLPPAEDLTPSVLWDGSADQSQASTDIETTATLAAAVATPLHGLAPDYPDPSRPYWWFSTTPLPELRCPAGCAVHGPPGTRLPAAADFWCHEGDPAWHAVDRTGHPKPHPGPRKARSRR